MSLAAPEFDRRAALSALFSPGTLLFALSVLLAAVVFEEGFRALLKAWQKPEFSHGPLIPVISGYLFLRQLKTVPPAAGPVTDRWPGFLVILGAIALGLVGKIARIDDVVAYAIIVWIFGMILVSFGWRRGILFWPPVLHLAFMLPLPDTLFWRVSLALQYVSSEIGVAFIRSMSIPVFLDGNIIDLGVYKLHVAEACSGLRYLFPVMSFTYIFAVLYQGPIWIKAILLLSAAPLTVLMNSVRIGIIGVMVENYGIEHAEGFLHLFEGWVIFITCIGLLLGLSILMQRLTGDRRPLSVALDLEFAGLGQQVARVQDIRPSPAMLSTVAALFLAGAGWAVAPERAAAEVPRTPFALFPRQIADWQMLQNRTLRPGVERVLGADDYLSATFASPAHHASVDFFVAWYRDQTSGGIHAPEICIPSSGWEMSKLENTTVTVPDGDGTKSFDVIRAIIRNGLERQLVYYWFDQRGRKVTSSYAAKAYLLLDAVTTQQTDGALVRLITPIAPVESDAAADARLQDMLAAVYPRLDEFVPDATRGAP